MKLISYSLLLLIFFTAGSLYTSATDKSKKPEYAKTNIADLVLIYQGGAHRNIEWNKDQFTPYVVHQNKQGKKDWLFDGFLFLEFKDGKGRNYAPGYEKEAARRTEWEWLMERQFEKDKAFSALDQSIDQQIKELGTPSFRHKLVVGIPAPVKGQKDWGSLERTMDFSKNEDCIEACKWYIDRFLDRYQKEGYQHLDLQGFYWVPENDGPYSDILPQVGDYIRSKNLRLFWIPYWRAVGFDNWKTDKFDFAYIQPNHFFNKTISYERLDAVCAYAKGTHMGLEMEFDETALADVKDSKRDRLISYIKAFEDHDVFRDASVAYYQGGSAIYQLSRSKNPLDRGLLDRLAKIIIERKKMKLPKK
jgi:hypothetical protein